MRRDYSIREVFWTLQGEGSRAGTAAVFVRFAGCNLWDGLEEHRGRGRGACARWCDTDFARGEKLSTGLLLAAMERLWPRDPSVDVISGPADRQRWCVLTGGEPLLQVDAPLLAALHAEGWHVALETNGTQKADLLESFEHVTVSPKLSELGDGIASLAPGLHATDLKVVVPGHAAPLRGWSPGMLDTLAEVIPSDFRFLQPMDPAALVQLAPAERHAHRTGGLGFALDFIRTRPWWRLSVQTHKVIGVP